MRIDDGGRYDVVVVGGGAAGLSAALMLGRARRSVLVADGGRPRNAPAARMHGFLSRDGMPPERFLEAGRREVASYGGEVVTGLAVSAAREGEGFAVRLDTGRRVWSRRLLVAAGITDELPDVPGLAERWGRDVLHCPYCHGWEVRDQPIGILACDARAVHQALLFRQWTDKVTLLTHTGPGLSEEEAGQLAARGVAVVDGEVSGLEMSGDALSGVRLRTGEVIPLRALAVAPRAVPHAAVLSGLGLLPVPHPSGGGEHIEADAAGRTAVPGVWVAGNVADPLATVILAAASGATAAGAINADLIAEETRRAVRAERAPFGREAEARACERVLGVRRHGI
ncbi:thioredoxin reductase [Actinomadura rubrobrunea]|uniref:Thioredoxin reductase n=1 Tax=Actinomadura rubrobrunea TaxID=115335 RepID=A0A9W6UXL1_9ACTN|nr:NAD(P)/FAD-dependent oxidoreductase [Actinomadura rubrobrunea]GLW66243.1 thioredoxin reductase [Actinomadura rubrobrunea]